MNAASSAVSAAQAAGGAAQNQQHQQGQRVDGVVHDPIMEKLWSVGGAR